MPDVLQLEKYKTLKTNGPEASHDVQNILFACVKHVCDALVSNEASLNLMDTGSGDADCGSTLARGARKVKEILEDNRDHLVAFPSCLFREIAKVMMNHYTEEVLTYQFVLNYLTYRHRRVKWAAHQEACFQFSLMLQLRDWRVLQLSVLQQLQMHFGQASFAKLYSYLLTSQ